MNPVGIFGGTFDPIHTGHLITALAVKELRGLEKIIFVPAFISPHKTENIRSAGKHRLNMVKLATENIPFFEWSDFELNKEGVSFTLDTILELKNEYHNLELIIGYDNLLVFDKWKDPEHIFDLVKVVVLNRKTDSSEKNRFFDRAVFVNTPVVEISATEIRKRVSEDLPIDFLVPENVKQYILSNNLYKEK